MYFMMPSGAVLHRHRRRAFVWGYGHIVVFGSLVAVGAGLDVAALSSEGEGHLDAAAVAATVAVPAAVLIATFFVLYSLLLLTFDPFVLVLAISALALLAASVAVAATGAPIAAWLGLVVLAPVVVIVGYETIGHRRQARQLERILA